METPNLKVKLAPTGNRARNFLRSAGNWTWDFLYVTGIQSVRVLKRIRRRLAHFLRPAAEFCKRLYEASLGRQVKKVLREFQSIREGFGIARIRIQEARKQGYWRALKESVWVTGKSLVRHKNVVYVILNVVAPVAAVVALVMTVQYWNSLNYGLELSLDGKTVATIQNEKVYEKATEMVSQRMIHNTSSVDTGMTFTPAFRLSVVDTDSYSTVNKVCNQIIQQSNGIIEEASGLYVDGELIGSVKSSADLNYILQSILSKSKGTEKEATAAFVQNVETINGLFPTTSIMTTEAMQKMLTGTSKAAVVYTVKEGDTTTSIAKANNLSIAELNKINNNKLGDDIHPGDLINVEVAVPMLGVQLIKSESYQVPLSFKTITNQDSSQYTDYSKVLTQGQNGVQQCVDKVYYVNGVETKRDVVSRSVIKDAVDKVVVTGTKSRPKVSSSGRSTGNMTWPVPSLGVITTYFTWRWGSFHTGIDISGSGAYGKTIVAADGGTVVSAGWKNGYGNCIEINHGNGIHTLYGHASKLLVSSGQKVSKGQAIARVGSTGNSTGPHCHFEVIKNGTKINPLGYVHR